MKPMAVVSVETFAMIPAGSLGLFSLEKRNFCGDLTALPVSKRAYPEAREGLSVRSCSDRTRGNG